MQELKANTQVKVVIGPVVAVGDGFTPITTLALSTADEAELMKHDAAAVVDISGATFAAITGMDGYYNLTLTTSHTDTEGMLTIGINDDSLCLPILARFNVLSQAAWDSKYAPKDAGFMDVNIKTIGRADTQETEANNLEAACSNYSATRGLTGTALPAVAAEAAGGLFTRGTSAGQINQDSNGRIDTNIVSAIGTAWASGAITAASIATSALNGKGDWNTRDPLPYFQVLARADSYIVTDRAAEIALINANEGSGAGSYDLETQSLEAQSAYHDDTLSTAELALSNVLKILKNGFAAVELAISSVTSQTELVLTGGPSNNIANVFVIIFDNDDSDTPVFATGNYIGSTGTVNLDAATAITITTSDKVTLIATTANDVNLIQWKGNTPADLADTNKVQVSLQHDALGIEPVTSALGTIAAARLALSAGEITPGTVDTVVNGHTPTTTEFQADDITEATANHYFRRRVVFTSGTLKGQAAVITGYQLVGGIGQFTVEAMTEAPANNDTFIIV